MEAHVSTTTGRGLAVMAALLAMAAAPASAQTTARPTSAMDDEWHFNVAPYMWMPGISGNVSVANLTSIPVDASIGDLLSKVDIGLQGRFEARRNRFGLAVDFSWNNLGVDAAQTRVADFKVDVRQVITEGLVFYRVANGGRADNPAHLDVIAGARYTGARTRLTAVSAAGAQYDGDFQELSWVDALAGIKFRAPLGSRVSALGRGDVAGFGSKVTWNVEGDLAFLAARNWTVGAGWRYMDFDYEKNDSVPQKQFKLAYSGPRVWFAYSW
jgi:hypothetical protein